MTTPLGDEIDRLRAELTASENELVDLRERRDDEWCKLQDERDHLRLELVIARGERDRLSVENDVLRLKVGSLQNILLTS